MLDPLKAFVCIKSSFRFKDIFLRPDIPHTCASIDALQCNKEFHGITKVLNLNLNISAGSDFFIVSDPYKESSLYMKVSKSRKRNVLNPT